MNTYITKLLLTFIFSSQLSAEQMVFLIEDDSGKHVGVSKDFKTYKRATKGKDLHLYPAISSDQTKLAYIKGSDVQDLHLVIRDEKTKTEIQVSNKGFVLHPSFSKNGKRLFFSIEDNGVNRIAYVNLENLNPNTLPTPTFIDEDQKSFFPAPFNNGEVIVYQRNAKDREIVLFDMANNKKTIIGKGMSPALSKNERYIAYTSKVDENWDINVYDLVTKKTLKVTTNVDKDFSPQFDRHNNLIYTSDRLENGVFSIFRQKFTSWINQKENEELLISESKVSFYAPKISGVKKFDIKLQSKMIGKSRSSFGAISYKGKIYAVGGHQGKEHTYPPESFTGRVTQYDSSTKSWSNKASRLHKAHGFQLAAYDNKIYAFGGFSYEESTLPKWKSLDVVEEYDIKNNQWKLVESMPRKRSSNVVAQVGDKVYLIGGWDSTPKFDNDIDGTFHDEIDVFDFETKTWSTLETKLPKKRRAFSSFVKDNKIYLAGGISEGGSHFSLLDNFTEFDPQTETFKELPKLPFATFAPGAGKIGEEAFVFGGMFKLGKWDYVYVPHIYTFDFKNKSWSHTGRYLSEDKGFPQVVETDSCLGILGGHIYEGSEDRPVDTFEQFCIKN